MDPARFQELFRKHRSQLIAYAEKLLLGRRAVAEECVQDAYLSLWRSPPDDSTGDRRALFARTRLKVLDWLRKEKPDQVDSGDAPQEHTQGQSLFETLADPLSDDAFASLAAEERSDASAEVFSDPRWDQLITPGTGPWQVLQLKREGLDHSSISQRLGYLPGRVAVEWHTVTHRLNQEVTTEHRAVLSRIHSEKALRDWADKEGISPQKLVALLKDSQKAIIASELRGRIVAILRS